MDNEEILTRLEEVYEQATPRNFTQSVDLVFSLKDLNLNNPDEKVDTFVTLPEPLVEKQRVAAFVGPDLVDKVEPVVDKVVTQSEFDDYASDSKKAKDLAKSYDYFMAQADIMPQVATTFGRYLGPRGKMPNPRMGSVVNPKSDFESLYTRFQRTVRLRAKKDPIIQVKVGREDMDDKALAKNIKTCYDTVLEALPNHRNNVKQAYLKLTMSKPVELL
jgi:large subunit ribosomal protein L1